VVSGGGSVSGDGLARVTYLPGVVPPPSPDAPTIEVLSTERLFSEAHPGEFVDEEPLDAFEEDTPSESGTGKRRREVRAENVSMHALTRRGLSRWELQKTLLSREFDEHIVEAELDRLEGVGLLDDAALAATFVRTQHERKGLGRGAIIAELRRRHIDQAHIDSALEQIDDDDEQSRATELAVKRAEQLSSYDLETAKRRLHGFLSRKGYNSSVVRSAIDEALSSRSALSPRAAGSPRSDGVRFR
jgi:regulatory protein